ncbi:MAG TPA: mercuric transporter MerT family protein [Vicinamibacterales bacterium]
MSAPSRTRWSEIGALTSAGTVAATILCCVPFATGIVGASLAAVGARFVPVQPYLIAGSLGLLAYSFYQAYRRDATCVGDGCRLPASVRRRRTTVWFVSAVVVCLLTANWWASWLIYWTL